MKNIWKYVLGIAVVAILIVYAFFSRQNSDVIGSGATSTGGTNPTTTTSGGTTGSGSGTTTGGGGTTSTGTGGTGGGTGGKSGGGTGATGQYKDGNYTGPATDAFYGTMQVQAVISGGKLTDVQFLQYPNAPGHTTEVANFALPQLKQEAIAAQNANVNIVSGATQDSVAFQQSLAVALAQAKN